MQRPSQHATEVFHNVFRTINADIVIVPRWIWLSYWAGETATFELFIAHGGGPALHGSHLKVRLGKTRRIELADQAAQTVQALRPITLPVPDEPEGCMRRERRQHFSAHTRQRCAGRRALSPVRRDPIGVEAAALCRHAA